MPRDGSGVYTQPFPDVVTSTTVASTVFNGYVHDVTTDLNAARPIVAGGTGGNSAAAARTSLVVETYGQVVTNYDSMAFLPGSFMSDSAATSPPVVGHAFVGTCAFVDGNNMFLTAYDRDDAAGSPGAEWFRQKKAGVWSSWAKSVSLSTVGTPSTNQFTIWSSSTALQGVTITGLVKGNGASAPTAAASGTDYAPATSGSAVLKGNGAGGFANAAVGTDFAGAAANPTATIGLSTVNGSASTAMRSDGAPALSQSITPTWTGAHIWSTTVTFNGAATFNAPLIVEGQAYSPLQTLTASGAIAWDVANGQKAKCVLGATNTFSAVTNAVEGSSYFLWLVQDGTGSRTATFTTSGAGSYDLGAAGAPILTTTANAADLLCFEAISIAGTLKLRYTGAAKGFT